MNVSRGWFFCRKRVVKSARQRAYNMGMRRLMAISAFALFLAVPVWAQHGGGGHGGGGGGHAGGFGGHASFGGSHGGGFSGGHVSSGMRSGPVGSRSFSGPSSQRSFSSQPFLHDGFRNHSFNHTGFNHTGFNHGVQGNHIYIHSYGFRNPCYGYACRGYGWGYGWPWAYGAYYDPWLWNSDSSYDNDYYNNLAAANQMNQQSLDEQQMRRQEEQDGDQDAYADRSYAPPRDSATSEPQGASIIPPTVLVFRDQHKEEVHNYAIVGQTLWNFSSQRTEKIPLAYLDLPATTKANDDRGVTFRVPGPGEGQ